MRRKGAIIILALLVSAMFNGCTPVQRGAVGGAAVGAAAGGLIGGNRKSALIGAGAGALGGALLNDALYR